MLPQSFLYTPTLVQINARGEAAFSRLEFGILDQNLNLRSGHGLLVNRA